MKDKIIYPGLKISDVEKIRGKRTLMLNIYCERCGIRPKEKDQHLCKRCMNISGRKKGGTFDFSDIDAKYLKASFDDFKAPVDERKGFYMPELITNDENLYFYGDVGRGKTYMIWAIVKYAREKLFYSVRVVEFNRFCGEIRKCFNKNSSDTEWGVIERYLNYDLLCFDDLGMSSEISPFEYEKFYDIINRRGNQLSPTIISSNKSIDEIGLLFDTRIASRLYGFKVIKFLGKDRRLK